MMRAVVVRFTVVALFACLALVAPVQAQDENDTPANVARETPRPADGSDDAMRRLEAQEAPGEARLKSMSPAERLSQASASVETMRQVLTAVNGLLDKTREEQRDVLKLNCINEKLSAIKGFVKVSEKAQLGLEEAIGRQDLDDQVHHAKLVQLADLRVRALGEEAEACTGNVVPYSGPADLKVEIDENVRTDNPTDVATDDIPTDPLPDVSGWK